jgi:dienelactone hydrolase
MVGGVSNPLTRNENWLGATRLMTSIRHGLIRSAAAAAIALALTAAISRGESPFPGEVLGPQGAEQGADRRQLWLIPSSLPGVAMHATVLRPPGAGSFPLMVMNHGSTQSAERRIEMPLPTYHALSMWFVQHGYVVVLPMRPGHGETGGRYLEDQKGCDDADYQTAGQATAVSIEAAITYMTRQPFVRRNGVVVVGQSAGGWGALALASQNPSGLRAVINFAGGRGGRSYDRPNNNCAPERLLEAARAFGSTSRIPTLWIYAENDSYFAPRLSRGLAEAFRTAGGRVDYQLLPAFGNDGHFLAESDASETLWSPVLQQFLDRLR